MKEVATIIRRQLTSEGVKGPYPGGWVALLVRNGCWSRMTWYIMCTYTYDTSLVISRYWEKKWTAVIVTPAIFCRERILHHVSEAHSNPRKGYQYRDNTIVILRLSLQQSIGTYRR